MRDLNFFEPYIKREEFKIGKEKLLYAGTLVIICLIIVFSIRNQLKIGKLNKEVSHLKNQIENKKTKEQIEEMLKQQEEIDKIKVNLDNIKLVNEKIKEDDLINEEFLQIISNRMPKDIILTSIYGDVFYIELTGISKDKYLIAEFEQSLRESEEFLDTFVSNITLDNKKYNFSLHIKLKDEEMDNDDETD